MTTPNLLGMKREDSDPLFEQRFRKEIKSGEVDFVFAFSGEEALSYLSVHKHEAVLILSDINMPKLNGMELREKIHSNEDLRMKSIPYLFFSTRAEQQHVIDAYSRSIQGFFIKPNSYDRLKEIMVKIVEYWKECESPNYIKNAQQ